MTTSQILTAIGIVFEFISVRFTIQKLFHRYDKRLDEMGKSFHQKIEADRREGYFVLGFLVIGMLLQGIAVFV